MMQQSLCIACEHVSGVMSSLVCWYVLDHIMLSHMTCKYILTFVLNCIKILEIDNRSVGDIGRHRI